MLMCLLAFFTHIIGNAQLKVVHLGCVFTSAVLFTAVICVFVQLNGFEK